MKQVFLQDACHVGSRVRLDEAQAHHLFDVLRTRQKETVRVICQGEVFLAHPDGKPFLNIFEQEVIQPRQVDITLCAALIKADKFEWMLQKAAELGVSRIVPFTCRNSVISIDPRKEQKKLDRWSAILQAACAQSNRADQVCIEPISRLKDLPAYRSECNFCAYEKENEERYIASVLSSSPTTVTAVIGPEGGFDPEEALWLEQHGFALCSLGSQILRAETAACYILSAIDYQSHLNTGWYESSDTAVQEDSIVVESEDNQPEPSENADTAVLSDYEGAAD